jgi:HAD superfamily hydrolase (TIGR01509 family)
MIKEKKYKGLLLDIDDTLYSYKNSHSIAYQNVVNFFIKNFKIRRPIIEKAYEKSRGKVHLDLGETASSHNRLIYFQNMCEFLKVNPLKYGLQIYNIYWDSYLKNLKIFEGIYDLLEKYKNKICLVTDLTAHIQYRKIKKLRINKYCKSIVTSEEAGKDKPNPIIFNLALQKLNLGIKEVCMIGDNFNKDIIGANSLGIDAIWFNHRRIKRNLKNSSIKEVFKFREILNHI